MRYFGQDDDVPKSNEDYLQRQLEEERDKIKVQNRKNDDFAMKAFGSMAGLTLGGFIIAALIWSSL